MNAHNRGAGPFFSFVRGNPIDYCSTAINRLLGLQAPHKRGAQRRRLLGNIPFDGEWDQILNELCCSGALWIRKLSHNSIRLKTINLRPIPKAWAPFFVSTLEATSNTFEFIVRRVFGSLAIVPLCFSHL